MQILTISNVLIVLLEYIDLFNSRGNMKPCMKQTLILGVATRPQSNVFKNLPKMLLKIFNNFYLSQDTHINMHSMLHINILVLCSNKNNTNVKILLLECSIRVFMIRG